MANFVITADSGCDLSLEFCKEKGILPAFMKYNIDGEDFIDSMDHQKIKSFYNVMRDGQMPKTAQLNEADFCDFWEPILDEGKDILHICMSSGISGTYQSSLRAVETLSEKYPERKIRVVDTLMTSTGNGLLAIECCRLLESGADFDTCADWAENTKRCVHACFEQYHYE